MTAELPDGSSVALHEVGRFIGRWLNRPRLRVQRHGWDGIPADGPLVVVANHSSMIEPQLLLGFLPRRVSFLVKQELFRGPVGAALRAMGQIPVRRGTVDRTPLMAAAGVLRGGGVIGVFPEGTRGSGDVDAAEQGAAWLARTSGALVLPVACRGTVRVPGSRGRQVVDLLAGNAFDPAVGKGRAGLAEGTERIRVALADLVRDLDRMRGQRPAPTTTMKRDD